VRRARRVAVRSFGTEGRVDPSREVQPTAAVYPLIVFKASDILDLKIISQALPTLNDPAIVSTAPPVSAPDPAALAAAPTARQPSGGVSGVTLPVHEALEAQLTFGDGA